MSLSKPIYLIIFIASFWQYGLSQCMTTGGFETPEWTTHSSGNWTETTSEGTWSATSSYVNGGSSNTGSNKFGMNSAGDNLITPAYTNPCDLSFYVRTSSDPDNWVMDVQTSVNPGGPWNTVSTVVENGVGGAITNAYSQITVPLNLTGAYYIRFFVVSRSDGSIFLDDISLTCNCVSNTITTGAVSAPPFNIDCSVPTTASGTVAFTSIGTFNAGNVYTAELSDVTGSFASPVNIGSLASIANSGSINITIPSGLTTGAGYLIRVISDNPVVTGTSSAAFTITQNGNCAPPLPSSQGLLINEFSNGPAGSQEYYEFVVAGQCGDLVDIRGYILDDNNGTFSTVWPSSSGVAQGHLRLTNHAQWASIPVGSLIVIYNDDDINPAINPPVDDDPYDLNGDSLYVCKHNNTTLFEITADLPISGATIPPADSTYAPVVYSSLSWNPLGLRNAGDAIQVRSPNGAYWHGISYGGAEMSGGPNNMKISTSGLGGNCGWFSDGDYLNTANWTTGPTGANETPGLPNNPANYAWLLAMRDPNSANCPITVLPVELIYFNGSLTKRGNELHWATNTETNSSHFIIERSINGKHWTEIHREVAMGNSLNESNYSFIDGQYPSEVNYYRLIQVDIDGSTTTYTKYVAIDNRDEGPVYRVKIVNLLGQEIEEETPGIQIHMYSDGSSIKHFKH